MTVDESNNVEVGYRAKAALLTMPRWPRWTPSSGYSQPVLDELHRAGLIEVGGVDGRASHRVTEPGQRFVDRLVANGL